MLLSLIVNDVIICFVLNLAFIIRWLDAQLILFERVPKFCIFPAYFKLSFKAVFLSRHIASFWLCEVWFNTFTRQCFGYIVNYCIYSNKDWSNDRSGKLFLIYIFKHACNIINIVMEKLKIILIIYFSLKAAW